MATAKASCSIRPKVLQRTATATERAYRKAADDWSSTYEGLRPHIPEAPKARLDAVGRTLWRFDLRYRWATGITALEFDDEVVTKATTAATKQGYFLLMRLVDLWFVLEIAFDLYRSQCIPSRVEHPSLYATLKHDTARRLRAAGAAAKIVDQDLRSKRRKADARERLVAWLQNLAAASESDNTRLLVGEAATCLERDCAVAPHHLAAVANLVRNQYVHGGETASSRGLSAQEKLRPLRLLTGFLGIAAQDMAAVALGEAVKQPQRVARLGS